MYKIQKENIKQMLNGNNYFKKIIHMFLNKTL